MKKNLLLHVCCAPCLTIAHLRLNEDNFNVTGFFYNPNIHPYAEYKARKEEVFKFFIKTCPGASKPVKSKYETKLWFETMKKLETEQFASVGKSFSLKNEPEGGKRCQTCYRLRLYKTAKIAKKLGFNAFTTTLTVSPHKNAAAINKIGQEIEHVLEIEFIVADFKKKDGFKKSVELSKKYNLRRQNYCGCVFSKMQSEKRKKKKKINE